MKQSIKKYSNLSGGREIYGPVGTLLVPGL
jgi:hypothetical protein